MANFDIYYPVLLKYEGGYVDNPNDKGGATNLGVTIAQWIKNGFDKDHDNDIDKYDLKLITPEDAKPIAKSKYWDRVKGDDINSQSIAELLMDWAYMSGSVTAIKKIQELLKLSQDGVIGNKTLSAINSADSKVLFEQLKARREKFFKAIVANNPTQVVFLHGWINRNNSFKFHD